MKIRSGFVSNSSSSSFIAYGKILSCGNEELLEFIKNKSEDIYNEIKDETLEREDLIEEIANILELQCYFDEDQSYLGIQWADINDDETGNQFKQKIEERLRDLQPETKCGHIECVSYNR